MNRTLALAIGGLILLAPPARAEGAREAVLLALSGYEPELTRERLTRAGPGWEAALAGLAVDATLKPLLRIRALGCLGFVPTEATLELLESVLVRKGGSGGPVGEVKAALWALGLIGGSRAGALSTRFLPHPDPDVRAAAAGALAGSGAPDARELLRRRVAVESDDLVLHVLRAGLETAR